MAIKTFATGEVLTASDTNTYLANSGLVYVTGGTLSAGTLIGVNNCFTSTFRDYRIVFDSITNVNLGDILFQFAAGGSVNATANYYQQRLILSGGAITAANNDGATTFYTNYPAAGSTSYLIVDVMNPQIAENSQIFANGLYYNGNTQTRQTNGFFNTTTSFDGFRISSSGGGNVTARYTVYGYRNG